MNEQFINTYIEVAFKKIEEMTKNEIMLTTRLTIAEKLIASLSEEKTKLEASLNKKVSKTTKEEF